MPALSGYAIEPAHGLAGAQSIADLTSQIWDEDIDVTDYPVFARHIELFPAGHLVARYGQTPVGSAAGFPVAAVPTFAQLNRGVYRLYVPCGPLYYLHLIQVLPGHRSRGLGQRLLERQIDIASAAGCTDVIGIAAAHAIGYWRDRGFVEFGRWGAYRHLGRFRRVRLSLERQHREA